MKLYSKHQLFIVIIAAFISGVALTGIVFLAASNLKPQHTEIQNKSGSISVQDTPTVAQNVSIPTSYSDVQATTVEAPVSSAYAIDEQQNISVYEKYNAAVVNITTEVVAINWFLEPVPREGGSGSGSIIDKRGYVLTNSHVVANAYKIYISLYDGSRYEGRVVGIDAENDLAVIKFDPPEGISLTVIPFGDSNSIKVGQRVMAIGNPFGLERTLTVGIISGLGRPIQKDSRTILRDMIQTDASINPGNSGGPLLNSRGEMIGINTMIYSPSGGSVGVGFAVPVNTAKRVIPELIEYGKVKRGWIEMEVIQLFPALIDYMKSNKLAVPIEKGLLISSIKKGTNADRAGLRGGTTPVRYYQTVFNIGGDIIVAVDGMAVGSIADLYSALEDNKPGDTVVVEYYRGDKKYKTQVQLTERMDKLQN
ncbi:MAG TPA: trypsin-like peptidase domain-containing protein [Spirochaetia bacterium]|nr:trypsin-like peptidase domain-containing protein [Spirochaetales bacterium]HRS65031.1 trypsin-like peptidase domain-containing protein [Spirochaetia bacterium]HOT58992.1 trypsin-like peptidase domain-containing protein [Spirochaetales bacterium]HPD79739.1 trypsin-like peptidase domain-containing protein [Spirochaetales bacterium]HQK34595.1 trypsin-like peptidase domain-containing protein [Spirochaetales bacterium]